MTEDEFLLRLARLLTRREDRTTAEARKLLLSLALRIRALLSTFPTEGQILRTLRYNQLRPQILRLLQDYTSTYFTTLRRYLPTLDTAIRALIAEYLALPTPLASLDLAVLLATTNVLNRSTAALLTPGPTGLAPYTLQLERLLDTSIRAAILRDAPTPEILALITPTATRTRKGTVANAWLERSSATTSAVYWSLVTPALTEAAELTPATAEPPTNWRWNAVLDPKTCPRCRPLHNTLATSPTTFPEGPPPLHPFCRCVVLPQRT